MFLRQTKQKNGIYLSIVKSYRDSNGRPKQTTVKSLGFLHDLQKQYSDPVAFFAEEARKMTKDSRSVINVSEKINCAEIMSDNEDSFKNVGYLVLKRIYRELQIDKFWAIRQKTLNVDFNLNRIFLLLVISRALYPASKRETYLERSRFFESFDFSLNDVYRALDIFAEEEKNLQAWIFDHSRDLYNRNMEYGYFDCTNYYFEIEQNDTDLVDEEGNIIQKNYRKRGPEKNHRPDPIIEMGLLMDSTGIPLAYDLFPGNESEKLHLRPALNRARNEFGIGRTILVADRGINTSDNIYFISGDNKGDVNNRDGYVYGQSVRGADREFKDWVTDPKGYIKTVIEENGESIMFTHKSRIYPKTIYVTTQMKNGKTKKRKITVDQKQMAYYSEKYAKRQKAARDEMIARARDLIAHPKKYDRISAAGASGYVLNLSFKKETGEIVDKDLILDEDKIREEERFDGFYSIVTSELDMPDEKIRQVYRGLAKIEDTFKVTKSTLRSRPVYVWTKESIEAHFMTCFTSLVILRLLEKKTGEQYSLERLVESMKKYGCVSYVDNTYRFIYNDEIISSFSDAFNLDLNKKYRTKSDMKKLLQYR